MQSKLANDLMIKHSEYYIYALSLSVYHFTSCPSSPFRNSFIWKRTWDSILRILPQTSKVCSSDFLSFPFVMDGIIAEIVAIIVASASLLSASFCMLNASSVLYRNSSMIVFSLRCSQSEKHDVLSGNSGRFLSLLKNLANSGRGRAVVLLMSAKICWQNISSGRSLTSWPNGFSIS
jgi:hypothetical protein